MEFVKNISLMLLFAAASGLIYHLLLPSGKISETAKSVLSVFILMCTLGPLFSFFSPELPELVFEEKAVFSDTGDILAKAAKSEVLRQIDVIIKKYTAEPYDIELSVNISEDQSIDIEQVRIVFDAEFPGLSELVSELTDNLSAQPDISFLEDVWSAGQR